MKQLWLNLTVRVNGNVLEDSLLNFQINECTNEANQHKCRLFNPAEQSDIVIDKEAYFQLILIYLVLTLKGSKRS